MKKTLKGRVIKVNNTTAIVEVVRKVPHPLYRKIITKTKKYHVDTAGMTVKAEDVVTIVETPRVSATKFFKVVKEK